MDQIVLDTSFVNEIDYPYMTSITELEWETLESLCVEALRTRSDLSPSMVTQAINLPSCARHEISRFLDLNHIPRLRRKRRNKSQIEKDKRRKTQADFGNAMELGFAKLIQSPKVVAGNTVVYASAIVMES